jgi:hypothetical protein
MAACLDCRRIDVPPQISESLFEVVEPLIDTGGALVQTVEAPIGLLEAPIHLIEAPIDLLQALVDVVQALVDVLAQGIERRLQLRIHGVILLQSKEGGIVTAARGARGPHRPLPATHVPAIPAG